MKIPPVPQINTVKDAEQLLRSWERFFAQPSGSGGTPGPTGPTGPAGPTGPTGPTGSAGARGDIGPILPAPRGKDAVAFPGPTGSQGLQGVQGIQGVQGTQGPTGQQGPIGPYLPGPAGSRGADGFPGCTGPQGPQGLAGNAGATGPAGPSAGVLSFAAAKPQSVIFVGAPPPIPTPYGAIIRLTADAAAIAAALPTTGLPVATLQQPIGIGEEWDVEWILHVANSVATDVFVVNVTTSAGTFTGRYTVLGANGVPNAGAAVVKFWQMPTGTITTANANAPGATGTIGLVTTIVVRAQGIQSVAAGLIQVQLRAGTNAAASSGTATVKARSQMFANRLT